MGLLRPKSRAVVRAGLVACAAWLALYELHVVLAKGIPLGPLTQRGAHLVVLLASAVLCLVRAALVRRERGPWLLLGLGVLAWSLGEVYYTIVLWDATDPPIPSPADIGYLLFPPLALAGLLGLLRARARGVPGTLWADGLTAALAVASLSAAIVFDTVLAHATGKPLAVATALAYPLTDLVLLAVAVGALAGTGWRMDRTWLLLAAGIATFWLADSLYLVRTAAGVYESGGWFDAGWWAGLFLVALAAWQQPPERPRRPSDESARLIAVPLLFGLVGLGLLVYSSEVHVNALAIALAAASLVAVMVRLTLTFRQNVAMLRTSRSEALSDSLTGLGNRRALQRALAERLPEIAPERPLVLALFDLDGFKHYNDTFGHTAGDALLVRLGNALDAFLGEHGRAYRMGGDEFCALLDGHAAEAHDLVAGAGTVLSERGEGFSIGCSYGAIELPTEATAAADALRIADQRMYASKYAGRMSASRQSIDVLLRAISERNPELGGHLSGVAELAGATAQRLGLPADEVEVVRQAAELHDVGKVAIPDAILAKPGPLSEEEWEFIRRHTLVGERIIGAAPALTRVARLVRSSHERWDGEGYPDGLAGEAIPLGARVIAVADAFDAMIGPRSYRVSFTPQRALAELRLGAGSQFDPQVVAAFAAAWAESAAAEPRQAQPEAA